MANFEVYVDDNYHSGDEEYRYHKGSFSTYEAAVAACKAILDEWLQEAHKPGMSFEEMWQGYMGFGEDPFIEPMPDSGAFSAWNYVKERCAELCG